MKEISIISDNIITSLGFTTDENIKNINANITGIENIEDQTLFPSPFFASLVDTSILSEKFSALADTTHFTRFEQMVIVSIHDALSKTNIDITDKKTLIILSTTKGNIDLLEEDKKNNFPSDRLYLWSSAKVIQHYFKNPNIPIVVSNACISGVVALIVAERLMQAGYFNNIVIVGADIVSEFVVSGFLSFKSLSVGPCKPFDKDRDGLSLGEGCGTIILSTVPQNTFIEQRVLIGNGAVSNDANHISGPSRTGEGLYQVIQNIFNQTEYLNSDSVDYISAHGTATPYNDEMEAIAISRSDLEQVPVNSFKGYWGHTLGAAGIIETIVSAYSLKNNILFNTLGFLSLGVSKPINVIDSTRQQNIQTCLKLASGFGGCNAGVLLIKK